MDSGLEILVSPDQYPPISHIGVSLVVSDKFDVGVDRKELNGYVSQNASSFFDPVRIMSSPSVMELS